MSSIPIPPAPWVPTATHSVTHLFPAPTMDALTDEIWADLSPGIADVFAPASTAGGALQLEQYLRERVTGVPSTPENIRYGYKMSERWAAAVARVRAGAGSAKVLCIGDSTTAGIGSSGSNANLNSWPSVMAQNLLRNTADTIWGLSIPPSDNRPDSDPRWVLGSGWAQAGESGVGLGGRHAAYKAGPGSGDLEFLDPRINANRYDIYYLCNESVVQGGTFTAQVGSGTPVVVDAHSAPNRVGKVTVAGPGLSTSTPVKIRNTGTQGYTWIIGIEPHQAGDTRLRIANAGVAASDTSSWLAQNGGSDAWNVLGFLPVYDPDLVIIDLGINDAGANVSVSSYISRIQTLVNAADATGAAVLIKTMIPSDGTRATREAEYVAALKTQLSPRVAVLDLFTHYGSWARNNARGWMTDWGHGTDDMYQDVGELVAEMLFRCADGATALTATTDTGWVDISSYFLDATVTARRVGHVVEMRGTVQTDIPVGTTTTPITSTPVPGTWRPTGSAWGVAYSSGRAFGAFVAPNGVVSVSNQNPDVVTYSTFSITYMVG